MTYDRDFFTPDNVEEQVDQLSQHSMRGHLPRNERAGEPSQVGAYLVGDLKAYYQIEQQEDIASLERAWKRISARMPEDREHFQSITTQPLPTPIPRGSQGRIRKMRNSIHDVSRGGNFSRRLSLLVAVLVSALLVGGLAAVLNLSRQVSTSHPPGVTTENTPTATSTPAATRTPAPVFGKTLYITPANQWGFESLSWSPDSKRVASATVGTGGVQFWDATTGEHLVTVQLPGGASEWAYGLSWSPNSEDVAVATNQHILIVNGQTGKVISSHATDVPTASSATSSGQAFLSSLFPASGGFGYRATAWSPDGHLMASALSFGPYGEVQVWNPQTGASDFNLKVGSPYNIGALAWSSDGQYIAGSTWNTQPTDPTQASSMVVVWNVSTHQMVFHHSDFMDSGAPTAWQPHSHNLAFVGATSSGGNLVATLEIWNATTSKLVKQYVGAGTGALAWSPDGTYLAYADFGGKNTVNVQVVIIRDVTTDKQIYVYNGHHLHVSVIAWSPNGKYLVSAEGNTQGQMVAEVWTA
jgi:WD40 repeat protein